MKYLLVLFMLAGCSVNMPIYRPGELVKVGKCKGYVSGVIGNTALLSSLTSYGYTLKPFICPGTAFNFVFVNESDIDGRIK